MAESSSVSDYLIVRGSIDLDGNSVQFLPFNYIHDTITTPPSPEPATYTLDTFDGNGMPISSVDFQPSEIRNLPGDYTRTGSFIIPILADANIKQVAIFHDANLLRSQFISVHPPRIEVVFPNGGEVFDGNEVSIEWIADDIDGNELTYVLQYSADAGITWDTLFVDWPGPPNYIIERKYLNATNKGLVRVIASDGFNTATDESDGVFTVVNNAPYVVMFQPKANAIFDANQLIFFQASALDREDGQLSGGSLQWSSSADGSLGQGKLLTRDSNSLSQGYHLITVTATDSNGLTDTASVNIWIGTTPADLTGNGKVNFTDYASLADQWHRPLDLPSADIAPPPDGDGIVDLLDLALMALHWLEERE